MALFWDLKVGQMVEIEEGISISIVKRKKNKVRVRISAPNNVKIHVAQDGLNDDLRHNNNVNNDDRFKRR